MARAVIAMLCVGGLGGCFISGKRHNTAYLVDGLSASVGTFLAIKAPGIQNCDGLSDVPPFMQPNEPTPLSKCQDNNHTHAVMRDLGATMVGVAIVGAVINAVWFHNPPAEEQALAAEESAAQVDVMLMEIETTNPQLVQLTKQAAMAARQGHCKAVAAIAIRVKLLAPEFRKGGFVSDPQIAQCLLAEPGTDQFTPNGLPGTINTQTNN
jgi:hypothetical protein